MIDHQKAVASLAISGSSFMGAHWFLVTKELLHMGAEVVSIASGIAAATYYVPRVMRQVRSIVTRMRAYL